MADAKLLSHRSLLALFKCELISCYFQINEHRYLMNMLHVSYHAYQSITSKFFKILQPFFIFWLTSTCTRPLLTQLLTTTNTPYFCLILYHLKIQQDIVWLPTKLRRVNKPFTLSPPKSL